MKFNVLKNESYKVGNIKKQRVIIKQEDNKYMNLKDVKDIVKKLEQKYKATHKDEEPKILVRGLDILGMFCLKTYDENVDDMFENMEDYLRGRAKDTTKFTEFSQIEISFFSEQNNS